MALGQEVEKIPDCYKKLIIFDFDGTLVDSFDVMVEYLGVYADEFGVDLSDKKFIEEMRNFHVKDIIKRFGINSVKIPIIVKDVRKKMFDNIHKIKPVGGMKDVLREIKGMGCRIGILTSNSKELVEKYLEENGLSKYFDFVYSERHIFGKDKSLIKIMKKYGMKPEEVLYVGDEARDVDACKKAGIEIFAVEWGFNSSYLLNERGADYIIDSPEEILLKLKYLCEYPGN